MRSAHRSLALLLVLAGLEATGCTRKVRVGVIASSTGAGALSGERVRNGLELAVSEINETGGLGGRPIELVYRDDATNPQVGLQMARELVRREGVRLIIGAVSSSVTLEIAPFCEKEHVLLLSPTASAPQLTSAGEYVFRNYPSDVLEGTSMADFSHDLGLVRMAVFAVANEYGAGLQAVFTKRLESGGGRVIRAFAFPEGATDVFSPMVGELVSERPDGIYVVGYRNDAAELIRRIRAAGIDAVLLGASSVTADISKAAGAAAEHLVFPLPTFDPDLDDPAVRPFVTAYRDRYDEDPDAFAAHGYDALELLVRGIERAGSTHPDEVRRGLLSIDPYRGANGWTSFDENGDIIEYPRLYIVHDGRAVPYSRFVEARGALRPQRPR